MCDFIVLASRHGQLLVAALEMKSGMAKSTVTKQLQAGLTLVEEASSGIPGDFVATAHVVVGGRQSSQLRRLISTTSLSLWKRRVNVNVIRCGADLKL